MYVIHLNDRSRHKTCLSHVILKPGSNSQIAYALNSLCVSAQVQVRFFQPRDSRTDMNGIFGRLPPCAINGFNYNHPPTMDFYNPEAQIYGKN